MTATTITLTAQQVVDVLTQDGTVAGLQAALADAQATIAARDAALTDAQATIAARDATISTQAADIVQKKQLLADLKVAEQADAAAAAGNVTKIAAEEG